MANNAKNTGTIVLAAGAAVLAIMYLSKASNSILDPIIQNETDRQKKNQAKKHVQETTRDKVLIEGKRSKGKIVKPYYVNLTTLAFQLSDWLNRPWWDLSKYDTEARNAILKIYPRHMPRLAEIYEFQTGKPLLQDITKHMRDIYQKQLGQYLSAI